MSQFCCCYLHFLSSLRFLCSPLTFCFKLPRLNTAKLETCGAATEALLNTSNRDSFLYWQWETVATTGLCLFSNISLVINHPKQSETEQTPTSRGDWHVQKTNLEFVGFYHFTTDKYLCPRATPPWENCLIYGQTMPWTTMPHMHFETIYFCVVLERICGISIIARLGQESVDTTARRTELWTGPLYFH